MEEYKIVNGNDKEDVETRIIQAMRAGWELQGGISITQSPSDVIYAQALKRERFKRDE